MGIPNSVDLSDLANSQQSLEEIKELNLEIPKVDVVVNGVVLEPNPTK